MSTFTNLLFHIVYSTKFRKPTIEKVWQDDLYGYVGGIIRENKGTLLCMGGVNDHVHLLAKLSQLWMIIKAHKNFYLKQKI
jgi:REP element-mobilizing transposase RayT